MMQPWFKEAKLGIFIHWGMYAVGRRGGESWPLFNGQASFDEYFAEIGGFDAANYDPGAWAKLFAESGAKYAVLTTKHHDGVALWPTKQNDLSLPTRNGLPDLVGPYVDALRHNGLKVGLYYSHCDWANPDCLSVMTSQSKEKLAELRNERVKYFEFWQKNHALPDPARQPELQASWSQFLKFHRAQLGEILTGYGPVDLIWFDGQFPNEGFDWCSGDIREFIHSICPATVINSRLEERGDYESPEQFIPVHPPKGPWEVCLTTNETWSFTGREEQYKTPFEVITMFCECLSMGGNLLLNVGPNEHGDIPTQQVELLKTLGAWIRRHEEAIYRTERGLPHGYAYHSTTLNKNRDTLYLYLAHLSKEGTPVKGIKNKIKRISVLGRDAECSHKRIGGAGWIGVPGTLWINVPNDCLDEFVTVLKVELDGPLDLYSGEGAEILVNE